MTSGLSVNIEKAMKIALDTNRREFCTLRRQVLDNGMSLDPRQLISLEDLKLTKNDPITAKPLLGNSFQQGGYPGTVLVPGTAIAQTAILPSYYPNMNNQGCAMRGTFSAMPLAETQNPL